MLRGKGQPRRGRTRICARQERASPYRPLIRDVYGGSPWLQLFILFVLIISSSIRAQVTSWNAHSIQFIDAPRFTMLRHPNASNYRAMILQGEHQWQVDSAQPRLDLAPVWDQIVVGTFSLQMQTLGRAGESLIEEASIRRKAEDWDATKPVKPGDWAQGADRAISYLIHEAEHGEPIYREPGVPVWIWEAAPRHSVNYPALQYPLLIRAFLSAAHRKHPEADAARSYARYLGEWLLSHQLPSTCTLPLFPFSTISQGRYEGGIEGQTVVPLRASFMAQALLELAEVTSDTRYLDYARHIARQTQALQQDDGGFPYRIDPSTGRVIQAYCTLGIDFVELVDALEPWGFDQEQAIRASRALEWLLAYPGQTQLWSAAYEDIAPTAAPNHNLSQMTPQALVRYLCKHRAEDPSYLPRAEALNRWIEDQFVLFGTTSYPHPGNQKMIRVKGPLVYEQTICSFPMDAHTGNWIMTLLALHQATGKSIYLNKAMAAGNALLKSQYANGSFCTFGRDYETGDPQNPSGAWSNWYGCTALAISGLYALDAYTQGLDE